LIQDFHIEPINPSPKKKEDRDSNSSISELTDGDAWIEISNFKALELKEE